MKDSSKTLTTANQRLRLFVEAILANGGDATAAAKAAGVAGTPGAIKVTASRLLARARTRGLLEHRLAKILGAMGAEEVQERLATLARADIGRHLAFDEKGDPRLAVSKDHTGIIREFVEEREITRKAGDTEVSTTVRRIKVADPLPALQTLAKIHGLEKDGSRPPQHNTLMLSGLPDDVIRTLLRHAMAERPQASEDTEVPCPGQPALATRSVPSWE